MNLEWPTSLDTMLGSDCCNTSDVIPFAAKNTNLQHFAATWWFL